MPPLQFPISENVDGTAIVNAITSQTNGVSVTFTFSSPTTAFGADFAALQNNAKYTSITIDGALTVIRPYKSATPSSSMV